jgi:hypothetical protein
MTVPENDTPETDTRAGHEGGAGELVLALQPPPFEPLPLDVIVPPQPVIAAKVTADARGRRMRRTFIILILKRENVQVENVAALFFLAASCPDGHCDHPNYAYESKHDGRRLR